jgi:hypothetical protein
VGETFRRPGFHLSGESLPKGFERLVQIWEELASIIRQRGKRNRLAVGDKVVSN